MQIIWAPWRMEYIQGEPLSECLFCQKFSEKDDNTNYILYRGDLGFIILNTYPYNNGHLMVAPIRHIADITLLNESELCKLMNLVQKSVEGLKEVYKPSGFNIGLNLGESAGAGITDHLHIHIVPRWQGDTNFMPALCDTKVMPQYLRVTYNALLPFFQKLKTNNRNL